MNNFKPKKQAKDVISIRIDTELLKEVDSIAYNSDISRSELIIQCIEFAMEHMEK